MATATSCPQPGALALWRGRGAARARSLAFAARDGRPSRLRRRSAARSSVAPTAADASRGLSRAEVDALVASKTLDELCALARETRARGPNPHVVTFSPKVFIPLTRACRDACGYCTFAKDPTSADDVFMSVPEILAVAEAGRRAGALECLFTLGDRPESKYPEAREALTRMGFESTAAYLAHCAGQVLEKTGLLPHCNAGVVSRRELARLRETSISQGLMLESSADRLVDDVGEAHFECDSKRPRTRMRVVENAGLLRIPFTSGILVGIGETRAERLDALFMIKETHLQHDHVQEILVQNFRAKRDTKMRDVPEPDLDELRWTVAAARLAFGPDMPIQCPPNLTPEPDDAAFAASASALSSTSAEKEKEGAIREVNAREDSRARGWRALLDAGVSCFGGISPERVTPDHVSPELAWPKLDQLARVTRDAGFALTPRLAAPPRFVLGREALETWVDARVRPHARVLSDAEGFARASRWTPGREEETSDAASGESPAASGGEESFVSDASKKNVSDDEKLVPNDEKLSASPSWRRARRPRARDLVAVDGAAFAFGGFRETIRSYDDDAAESPERGAESRVPKKKNDPDPALASLSSAIARLDARGETMRALAETGDDALRDYLHFDPDEAGFLYAPGAYRRRGGVVSETFHLPTSDETGLENVTKTSARDADVRAAAFLLSSRGVAFDAACAAADARRAAQCGDVVTWCANRNINYTNVCALSCSFCAFSKGKANDEFSGVALRGAPYLLAYEEVSRRVAEAWARGATEVCMQGGIHPEFTGETYVDLLRAAKRGRSDVHVHAFSPLEVRHGAETYGDGALNGDVSKFIEILKAEGLGSLPGTAAEILSEEVRQTLCPDKLDSKQWLATVEAAHEAGVPTTATMMFGHVDEDTIEARAAHLVAIRDAHLRSVWRSARRKRRETTEAGSDVWAKSLAPRGDAYLGGFTEFVPLPFVHFEAPAYLRGETRRGPTLRECVLVHAAARVTLGSAGLVNVQASWVKMGPAMAGALLRAGCNDLGGTLMNESITRAAGAAHGQEMGAEALREMASRENRVPKMRTTLYADAGDERLERAVAAAPLEAIEAAKRR